MRNTKTQAFTLVELIVVITILAILGTIAFISLQGYSADARNSKRTSDLGNIQSAMSLKQVEGIPLLSFIDSSTNDASIAGISLAGDAVINGATTNYKAGTPSYTVLNVAAKDFKDPSEKEYRIGGTTLKAGAFQIVATMEVDGAKAALVNGTFVARGSGTKTIDSTDVKVVTVDDEFANFFKAGDLVNIPGATITTAEVQRVSRDGVTVTLNNDATNATSIALANDETAGLVEGTVPGATGTGVVVDDSSDYIAY